MAAYPHLHFAGPLPHWDCDVRPRTRSSTSTDVSYPEDLQQGGGGGGGGCGSAGTAATGRRKIGRPIAYTGDPDAQHLTESERRRIKRRIANRESARRVRRKRQNALEDMQEKLEQVQGHALTLSARLQQAEMERAQLVRQLREMHSFAGEAGDVAVAAAVQQEEPASSLAAAAAAAGGSFLVPKLEPGVSAANAPSRSNVSNSNAMDGGGGALPGSGRRPSASARSVGDVPQGGAAPWCAPAAAADLPKPRQPIFVAVTPAASQTRVQCSIGKPAATPLSPHALPPPLPGTPLLDLQSMSSADDPLDCFLGAKPSQPANQAANPLGVEWRF